MSIIPMLNLLGPYAILAFLLFMLSLRLFTDMISPPTCYEADWHSSVLLGPTSELPDARIFVFVRELQVNINDRTGDDTQGYSVRLVPTFKLLDVRRALGSNERYQPWSSQCARDRGAST